MGRKATELEVCRERPSCGGAVVDSRQHRRWHEAVVLARNVAPDGPRFVGEPPGDEDDQDDGDIASSSAASRR